MKVSNYSYPLLGPFIIQGSHAGKWIDTKYNAGFYCQACTLRDSLAEHGGLATRHGKWRIVYNRHQYSSPQFHSYRDRYSIRIHGFVHVCGEIALNVAITLSRWKMPTFAVPFGFIARRAK